MGNREGGWWDMACWNGLSHAQQRQLVEVGTLELGYVPEGHCGRPATCCIETVDDEAPGPRFYCWPCAIGRLGDLAALHAIGGTGG